MEHKTTIAIAHRLSTIMKMDRIIVLDKWKIVEDWSHSQLLENGNGVYKKLWDIQSWGFIGE
jgi:ABC-type multidrug transport system fused ATPase/permease subunit